MSLVLADACDPEAMCLPHYGHVGETGVISCTRKPGAVLSVQNLVWPQLDWSAVQSSLFQGREENKVSHKA